MNGDGWGDGSAGPMPSVGPERAEGVGALPVFDVAERGRYLRTTVLGRGSMGRVVSALDQRLGRQVAVKEALDEADVARFAAEARLAGRLDHPGIVTVHDAGRGADGRPFYVMRLVQGRTLAQDLMAATRATRGRLLRVRLDVAQAVGHAHAVGVVHRDLKPENVLLGPRDDVQVGDWGLALDLHAPEEADGALVGTPTWISPEAARREAVGPTADVFALGVMLGAALGAGPPWGTGEVTALLTRAAAGGPAVVSDAPRELTAIWARATATAPGDRYPDAGSFARDLAAWLDGDRVSAHDYSSWELLTRLVHRWRAPIAGSVVALGLLGVGAAVATGRVLDAQHRALDAERTAVRARDLADDRLAGSLVVQARHAAAQQRWPEAAVLAANARALRPDPSASGVLAAAATLAPARLLSSGPSPCQKGIVAPDGRSVLCVTPTTLERWDVGVLSARWRLDVRAQRVLWDPVLGAVALVSGPPGMGTPAQIRVDPHDGRIVEIQELRTPASGAAVLGVAGAHAAWPVADGILWLDGTHRRAAPCGVGEAVRGLTWADGGEAVAMVCRASRRIVVAHAGGGLRTWSLPERVDSNAVVGVHALSDGWLILEFGGTLTATGDDGVARWRSVLPVGNVRHLAGVPGDPRVVVQGDGGPLVLDTRTGAVLARLPEADAGPLAVVAGADGMEVHTWGRRHAVWSVAPVAWGHVLPSDAGIGTLAWSDDGAQLALGDGDGDLLLRPRELAAAPREVRWQAGVIKGIVPDGPAWVVAAMEQPGLVRVGPDGSVEHEPGWDGPFRRLFRWRDGRLWAAPFAGFPVAGRFEVPPPRPDWTTGEPVWVDVDRALHGEALVAVDDRGKASVVEADGSSVAQPGSFADAHLVARASDGSLAVAVGTTLRRCAADGACVVDELPARAGDLAVDAAGRLLVAREDGGVVLMAPGWAAGTPQVLAQLDGHTDRVVRAAWSPDGREVATASWDGTVRRWRLGEPPGVEEVEQAWGITLGEVLGEGRW